MSLTRINHNIASLNAQRHLAQNTDRLGRAIERLSSGLRINRAADDPSGLVISEILRKQISGLDVAIDNASEGVNVIKTAEAALNEVSANLRLMRDLALDAASESNNDVASRSALNAHFQAAIDAINQTASTTAYSGLKLLDGSCGMRATVLDAVNVAGADLVGSSDAVAGLVTVDVTTAATKATATGNVARNVALVGDHTITLNGVDISLTAGMLQADVVAAIDARTADTGVDASASGNFIKFDQTTDGSDKGIVVIDADGVIQSTFSLAAYGVDAVATVTWGDASATAFDQGKGLVLTDADGNQITMTAAGGEAVATYANALSVEAGQLSFQTGYEVGQTSSTSLDSVTATSLGISILNISSVAGANTAVSALDLAITTVSTTRGDLGAFQAGLLETTIRSLSVARENLTASESSIRDADFGEEVAEFSTSQILVQSATSFLTQANALPQNVLALIQR